MEETHSKRLLVLCSAHHPWLCLLTLCSPLNDEMNILYASAAEHLTSSFISPPSSWHKRKQPVENDLAGPVKSPRNSASSGPHIDCWCSLFNIKAPRASLAIPAFSPRLALSPSHDSRLTSPRTPSHLSIFNSHRTSVSFSSFSCPYLRIPPRTTLLPLPPFTTASPDVHPPPLPSPLLPPSLLPVCISIPFSPGWSERGVCGCLLLARASCNPSSAHCFIQQFFDPLLIPTYLCLSSVHPPPTPNSPPHPNSLHLPFLCAVQG